jgi:acetyltransferase-like isoleucine patch superfamily enzyme
MKVIYSEVRSKLEDGEIYFSPRDKKRLPDDAILNYSEGCDIEPHTAFLAGTNLFSMGAFSYSWTALPTNTRVGRYCSIAKGVKILGTRHPMEWISTSSFTYDPRFIIFKNLHKKENSSFTTQKIPTTNDQITIGNDVWIGADAILKPGISIGNGAVIAASALVVKDVPDYAIIGGNPGKIIKYRFNEDIIHKLSNSNWWDYKFTDFEGMDFKDPLKFHTQLAQAAKLGKIEKFAPEKIILTDLPGAFS